MSYADLKLENILLSNSNDLDVKIADFGLAVHGSRAHGKVGTHDYMAPEIMMSSKQGYTAAVDCWSLGIILHGLLLGFLPYSASTPVKLFGCVNAYPRVSSSDC